MSDKPATEIGHAGAERRASAGDVVIVPWRRCGGDTAGGTEEPDHADHDLADLDAIFFEASGTKSFASDAARTAFRERWLGRYLAAPDSIVLIARAQPGDISRQPQPTKPQGRIVGYVVGTLIDPATDRRFDDIAYFRDLAAMTARYPAHLHVNCAPHWRGHGLGAGLVTAFAAAAASAGAPGVHIVTGADMRNVGFYTRNGFHEVARAQSNGKPVVMLARALP